MASEVQICNMALSNIGVSAFIESMGEASLAAQTLSIWYAPTLDKVLSDIRWPFATKRAALQDIGSPPDGWGYRYRYPNDCVFARGLVLPGMALLPEAVKIPFNVESDGANGKAIVTNEPEAILEYTMRFTETGLFPPPFVDAFAWALAARVAAPITSDMAKGEAAGNFYQMALRRAASNELSEGHATQSASGFVSGRS
jgi:hypothetical protein